MTAVRMRLRAPWMSWGLVSRNLDRGTEQFPTKSAVIGLVANALGYDRYDEITELNNMQFGVGQIIHMSYTPTMTVDYQTVGGGYDWWDSLIVQEPGKKIQHFSDDREIVGIRTKAYLQDADFLAVLIGETNMVKHIAKGIENPKRPLFLGRRSCPPSKPVFIDIIETPSLQDALQSWNEPSLTIGEMLLECNNAEANISFTDQPINFGRREYRSRNVKLVIPENVNT